MWECLIDRTSGTYINQIRNTSDIDIWLCNHFWICLVWLYCDGCIWPSLIDFMHHVHSMLCCYFKAEVSRDRGIGYKGQCEYSRTPEWWYSKHIARSWQRSRDGSQDFIVDHSQHHIHSGRFVCCQFVFDMAGQFLDNQGIDARVGYWLSICSRRF